MREIKFRLIRDGKIVGYEQWDDVTGWVYAQSVDGTWKSDGMGKLEIVSSIPHDSKEQYIGWKDKNGKEIHEGDVVKLIPLYNHKPLIMEVKYEPEHAQYNLGGEWDHGGVELKDIYEIEVIGNVHQHPELLK